MSLRFRSAVIYDRIQMFARDIYVLTNKFPEFEKDGMIRDLRLTCNRLVKETAEVLNKPKGQEETKEAYKVCLSTVTHIIALFDLAHHLDYITEAMRDRAVLLGTDITKYLYENKDVHGKN